MGLAARGPPGTEHIDTFSSSWQGRRVYLCPDPTLLTRVVGKMRRDGAYGTLIAPLWRGRAWWPLLCGDDSPVVASMRLPLDPAAFGADHADSIVSPAQFHAPLIAFSFDCRESGEVSSVRWYEK